MRKKNFITSICQFFDLSKSERMGLLILLTIIFIIITFRVSSKYFFTSSSKRIVSNEEVKIISDFYKQQNFINDSLQKMYKNKSSYNTFNFYAADRSVVEQKLNPFPFNPNKLPENLWKKLGLTDKQIKTIKNYEAKGGVFRSKEDFKKMYCISETTYEILEPYIIIPTKKQRINESKKFILNKLSLPSIELNTADSFDLMKIPGIGIKTANRIINYRERLGGFISMEQLLEIYTIDSNRYHHIIPYMCLNENSVKKININTATIKDMIKHPYIDYYLAKTIVMCRERNGSFKSLDDMKNQTKLYDELFNKLKPYLIL